jgi:hypothetical protein
MAWATLWAIISKTHLVDLIRIQFQDRFVAETVCIEN